MLKPHKDLTSALRQISTREINGYRHIVKPSFKDKNEWPYKKLNLKMLARSDNLKGGKGNRGWSQNEIVLILAGEPVNYLDWQDGYRLNYIRAIATNPVLPGLGNTHIPNALRHYAKECKDYMRKGQYENFVRCVADVVDEAVGKLKSAKFGAEINAVNDKIQEQYLKNY